MKSSEQVSAMSDVASNEVDPDFAIISDIVGGQTDHFRQLIARHQNRIFSLVSRQVQDPNVSEELTHEIFVKAYLNLKKFKFQSKFSTWLTRIALNHVNTYFSSKKFRQQKRTESFDPSLHDRMAATIDSDRQKRNLLVQFREALSGISPKLRDVIVLCGLEGKSYDEAAEVLNIPIGTVRSRLNAARLRLKDTIGTFDGLGE